jgi:hypothetical protein
VTPELNEELLKALEEAGLAMRDGVVLITFKALERTPELEEFIKEKTKMKLLEIDDESKYFNIT